MSFCIFVHEKCTRVIQGVVCCVACNASHLIVFNLSWRKKLGLKVSMSAVLINHQTNNFETFELIFKHRNWHKLSYQFILGSNGPKLLIASAWNWTLMWSWNLESDRNSSSPKSNSKAADINVYIQFTSILFLLRLAQSYKMQLAANIASLEVFFFWRGDGDPEFLEKCPGSKKFKNTWTYSLALLTYILCSISAVLLDGLNPQFPRKWAKMQKLYISNLKSLKIPPFINVNLS